MDAPSPSSFERRPPPIEAGSTPGAEACSRQALPAARGRRTALWLVIPSWLWPKQSWSSGDVKPFRSGPVRRPPPTEEEGHLANVGQEAPRWFSGYSQGE